LAYWLLKTEPETWSWDQQRARGKAGEEWTGVRNYQARSNLRAMKKGDLGFFYHTGSAKEIVGVVEVSAPAHSDSTDKTGEWISVDLKAVRSLKTPVSMAAIKAEPRLKNMVLVRNSRLSVQPVAPEEWRLICKMGGIEP
jgi:predicted RNA-binding protein with PUA-like domain